MPPEAHDCECGERGAVGVGGRIVHPSGLAPAAAWAEMEAQDRGAEHCRLLAPVHPPPSPHKQALKALQTGLTLSVWPINKNNSKCSLPQKFEKPLAKTKYQKRREKLVAALRPPYFILTMIVIITGVHVCGGDGVRGALEWAPGRWRREPWRLVTYGWVHASAAHVALNALVGLAVGWRLEREQGWWRAALVWAGGVAAGALGAGLLQPAVRVVGASAAVYALLTAHLPNVCLRFGHIPLWWFRPLSVVVLAASEAVWALLRAPPSPPDFPAHAHAPHDQVAWAAHVFGAAIGVPLAFLVFTGENKCIRAVAWCRAVSLALLSAAGAVACLYFLHCSVRAGSSAGVNAYDAQ